MASPRDQKITTEREARCEAIRIATVLVCNKRLTGYAFPKEAEEDYKRFGLNRNELDDLSIIEVINTFKAKKTELAEKMMDVELYQQKLDQIVVVLKELSPTFLLAYEAETYKKKRDLAIQNKDTQRERLHSDKYDGLRLYRRFLIPPDVFENNKAQDNNGRNIQLPNRDGELTGGIDDQHVKDRLACIGKYAPNLFKGFISSHAESIVKNAEALYRKKYSPQNSSN